MFQLSVDVSELKEIPQQMHEQGQELWQILNSIAAKVIASSDWTGAPELFHRHTTADFVQFQNNFVIIADMHNYIN